MDPTWLSPLLAVTLVFVYLLIMTANLSIVWYERVVSDAHRTLVNKLAALCALYNVAFATSCAPALLARVFVSALPRALCAAAAALAFSAMLQLMLAHNQIILLRYLYICRSGSLGALNEDLVLNIIVGVNGSVGSFFSLAINLILGRDNVLYSYCSGYDNVSSKYNLTMFLIIFVVSALNHACLGWKINRRIRRLNRVSNSIQVWSITNPPISTTQNKDPSLLDCKSSALFVSLLTFAAIIYLAHCAVGLGAASEWDGVAVMAIVCANALIILPLSVIVRKRHLRKTLIREMQEIFSER